MNKPPAGDNLNVCEEHGVMKHSDQRKRCCPLCIFDMEVEVRRGWELPGAADGDTGVKQQEIRQRIPGETLAELLPLMKEYLQDRTGEDDPELWIGVVGLDSDRDLPAGYSEAQERWINVVGYELGSRVKAVTVAGAAEETIETLQDNGYGDDPELVTDGGHSTIAGDPCDVCGGEVVEGPDGQECEDCHKRFPSIRSEGRTEQTGSEQLAAHVEESIGKRDRCVSSIDISSDPDLCRVTLNHANGGELARICHRIEFNPELKLHWIGSENADGETTILVEERECDEEDDGLRADSGVEEPGAGEGERIIYEYTDPLQSVRYRVVEELNPNPEHGIAYDIATYARPLMDDEWQDRGVAHARDVEVLLDLSEPEVIGPKQIGDAEVVPLDDLDQTGDIDGLPVYACPRCAYPSVTKDCDCPECGWAGMCQSGWSE